MSRTKQNEVQNNLFKPLEVGSWGLILLGVVAVWFLPPAIDKLKILGALAIAASYVLFFYHWLYPRFSFAPWLNYVPMVVNIAIVMVFDYLVGEVVNIDLIYPAIIVTVGIRVGRKTALIAAVLATLAAIAVDASQTTEPGNWLATRGFNFAIYVLIGYFAGSLSATIRQQSVELTRHNQDLALLVETSNVSTLAQEWEDAMAGLAEKIARGLPCTICSVALLHPASAELSILGVYPLRRLNGSPPKSGQRYSLEKLARHREMISARQPLIVRQDLPAIAMDDQELAEAMSPGLVSACLVPMIVQDRVVGIIAVGEARRWELQPIGQEKIHLLQSIAAQAAASINNMQLHQALRQQLDRMAVVNEVTRAITSTIEMEPLLELIYQQLSRVIPTDTYYVALHEAESNMIDMRVIIDEGVRFPPMRVSSEEGLASYVIQQKKPLLIHSIAAEQASLPITPRVVGKDKVSESWLGVPIILSDHLSGVLVVASYKPNAFDDDDVALLTTVASEAAIALDNARHHAQVEEQARRDSLTGAYNHGFLLQRLSEEVERACKENHPVTLIMLDVDHFKTYNDQFGHVMGDEVLRFIVEAIQAHVKPTDMVGRWGGEEFGVILPETTTDQARVVAKRIRETLSNLPLVNKDQQPVPKPTVSQGIATLPDHAKNASELIDLADRTLYEAKAFGRDMVIVASPRA